MNKMSPIRLARRIVLITPSVQIHERVMLPSVCLFCRMCSPRERIKTKWITTLLMLSDRKDSLALSQPRPSRSSSPSGVHKGAAATQESLPLLSLLWTWGIKSWKIWGVMTSAGMAKGLFCVTRTRILRLVQSESNQLIQYRSILTLWRLISNQLQIRNGYD